MIVQHMLPERRVGSEEENGPGSQLMWGVLLILPLSVDRGSRFAVYSCPLSCTYQYYIRVGGGTHLLPVAIASTSGNYFRSVVPFIIVRFHGATDVQDTSK